MWSTCAKLVGACLLALAPTRVRACRVRGARGQPRAGAGIRQITDSFFLSGVSSKCLSNMHLHDFVHTLPRTDTASYEDDGRYLYLSEEKNPARHARRAPRVCILLGFPRLWRTGGKLRFGVTAGSRGRRPWFAVRPGLCGGSSRISGMVPRLVRTRGGWLGPGRVLLRRSRSP